MERLAVLVNHRVVKSKPHRLKMQRLPEALASFIAVNRLVSDNPHHNAARLHHSP